jgi:hypothetical protein
LSRASCRPRESFHHGIASFLNGPVTEQRDDDRDEKKYEADDIVHGYIVFLRSNLKMSGSHEIAAMTN